MLYRGVKFKKLNLEPIITEVDNIWAVLGTKITCIAL